MGTLTAIAAKGKEVFSFEYEKAWLQSGAYVMLDPDLNLYSGRYFPSGSKTNFGIFLDSCPDRWGRVLMDRRENMRAKTEGRTARRLTESDYLLGVFDAYRVGGIRFKEDVDGEFVNNDKDFTTPPWTALRELQAASKYIEENDEADYHGEMLLNMLMNPGSSLGGARPKASVIDPQKHLWIAKFPSSGDYMNVGGWECVVNQLAQKAGIRVAEGVALKLNNRHHTYVSKRFDRENGRRRHFASALTMLGYQDGAGHESGVSYLEIAEFLMRYGAQTNADLEELWRRILFSVCVKNTDDHLRNHGFLLQPDGWRLSPAYDMNPNPWGEGLSLNISEQDNSLSTDLVMSVAEYFRVKSARAHKIAGEVKKAVAGWRKEAKALNILAAEQEKISVAFE
ncbi:MAG: HipA domain-containing protein [Bacteroidetes bacterium]|nr:HipA domain-containing protein [Bacteroidota bacterium]